jgi:hypothetical protein
LIRRVEEEGSLCIVKDRSWRGEDIGGNGVDLGILVLPYILERIEEGESKESRLPIL